MDILLSVVGATCATALWMFAVSYVDYVVARYQRFGGGHDRDSRRQLALEQCFRLPWSQASWWACAAMVFLAFVLVGARLGAWVLLLLGLAGPLVLLICYLADRQQLGQVLAQSPLSAQLIGLQGQFVGHVVKLDRHELSIGRSQENTLCLSGGQVSRQHAQICFARGGFFLQDLDSTHGTYVNSQRIAARRLRDGDQITICEDVFEFRTSARP